MEFRVLGPLELWDGARQVEVSAAKQRALLALLLLNANQVVTRDRLIEDLWEGSPPPAAKTTLQSCVYRLRRLLDDSGQTRSVALRTWSAGYLLGVPPDALDMQRFEWHVSTGRQALVAGDTEASVAAFRAGLGLWRGEAFADVDLLPVQDQARRLDDWRLDVSEQCLTAELSLGHHTSALSELAGLITDHPLRERLWELLMVALYRSGRRADALDAYRRLYQRLDADLGIEPGRAIRRLHQRILSDNTDSALLEI